MAAVFSALALVVFPFASSFAASSALPPCPPGWDGKKWVDPQHQTPKYAIGRIIAMFPHTPEGLRMALPIIQQGFPGTKIMPGKGDKADIPCVGEIDLIQAAGEGGKAWQWLVVKDKCGACKPNVCELGKSPGSSSSSSSGDQSSTGPNARTCMPPNEKATVDQVLARPGMAEAMGRACRHNTDWTFPDAVVDELRKEDRRWGYWCRRGKCDDPSHDVIAYYCGPGKAYEGADAARGIDYIVSSCKDKPGESNSSIGWTVLDPNTAGTKAWTSRGRFTNGAQTPTNEGPDAPNESIPASENTQTTTSSTRSTRSTGSSAAPRSAQRGSRPSEEAPPPEAAPPAAAPLAPAQGEPPAEEPPAEEEEVPSE